MSTRIQFRLSEEDDREIACRRPPDLTLSAWLRQLALGQAVHRSRIRPHGPAPMPTGTAAEMAKASALASLAVQLSDLIRRGEQTPGRLPASLEAELRELAGHVRANLTAL